MYIYSESQEYIRFAPDNVRSAHSSRNNTKKYQK